MVEIIPAILPKSYSELEEKLASIVDAAKTVQIDAVDGIFAPSKTWPYVDGEMFSAIVAQDQGLPLWEDFDFQFDCMVSHAGRDAGDFISAGASSIVIHGAGEGARDTLEALQSARKGDFGIELGVALLPGDAPELFAQYKEMVDFVQVMGIAKVGVQGSEFDARALDLIASLRQNHPELAIQVDGGVKLENARAVARAGANRLVVGSAIFSQGEPREAIEALKKEANKK
jgi:ribulose-phosphate 3-epimerase